MFKRTVEHNDCVKSTFQNFNTAIRALADLDNDYSSFVQYLLRLKGKLVITGVGKSGHIGRKLAATFSSTGTSSVFIHATESSHGDMGLIEKNDAILMLSASGATQELLDTINYAKIQGIPIAGITKDPDSYLALSSKYLFLIPSLPEACSNNLAPTTSTLCQLAVGDAIAVAVQKAKNFLPSEFKAYHPGGKLGSLLANVSDMMLKDTSLPLVFPNTTLKDVILEMTAKELGICGVIDSESQQLLGVFTDGDLRRMIDNISECLDANIGEFMNTQFLSIDCSYSASDALEYLGKHRIPNTFVLDNDGKPQGIIHVKQLT